MVSIWDTTEKGLTELQPTSGGEFEKPKAGNYTVLGIAGFVWTDEENGDPIFKPSVLDGRMQALLRLKVAEETPSILATLTVPELVVLVTTLGANPAKVLPAEETTGFLLRVQKVLEKITQPRPLKVVVTEKSTPYVKYWSKEFGPPLGEYHLRVVKIFGHDGQDPIKFSNRWGDTETARIVYEITGDAWGKPTPFDGFQIYETLYQPFDGTTVDDDGIVRPKPISFPDDRPGTPVHAVRLQRLLFHFAKHAPGDVEWGDYIWQTDPTESKFGVNEAENPFEVIRHRIADENRSARGVLERTKEGRLKVDLLKFVLAGEDDDDEVDVQGDKGTQSEELQRLVIFIEDTLTPDVAVFEPTPEGQADLNLELTPEGVKWAKENLVETWDLLELPKVGGKRQIGSLSPADAHRLYTVLKDGHEEANLGF